MCKNSELDSIYLLLTSPRYLLGSACYDCSVRTRYTHFYCVDGWRWLWRCRCMCVCVNVCMHDIHACMYRWGTRAMQPRLTGTTFGFGECGASIISASVRQAVSVCRCVVSGSVRLFARIWFGLMELVLVTHRWCSGEVAFDAAASARLGDPSAPH